MALISLSEWIDRYGDEPDGLDDPDFVDERLTFQVAAEPAPGAADYRIAAIRPIGSDIAATRTRLL